MNCKLILLCVMLSCCSLLSSAPLENIPIRLTQPDGSVINCYTSGDEFYHWLHDSIGNIIIKDSTSHYYCYRVENSDSLVIVRNDMISTLRFAKNTRDFPNSRRESCDRNPLFPQRPYQFTLKEDRSNTTINNIVIFITFADQSDFTTGLIDSISDMFNNSAPSANSVKQYYWESSYHQLNVPSFLFPSGTNVFSYQDMFPRAYYCPYSSENLLGYPEGGNIRLYREQTMLLRALSYVQSQIPSTLNIDSDNDGCVDNICFVIKGGTTEWNTLLWPHKWEMALAYLINGKLVYNYNLQLSDYIISHGTGVLCHEFGHTLGMPDLYHGYPDSGGHTWKPVGRWDIMASNGISPQQTSCYMKYKYLHWIDDIPEITRSGRYSLSPITSSTQCYKIHIAGSNEFLFLEYREKTQPYDTYIPRSGLIIYRINPSKNGNFNATECGGIDDEVYVYRPNGNFTSDGLLNLAPFCIELSATEFNATTNPQQFLSNGNLGNIFISNVSECGAYISFDVKICMSNDITYNQDDIIPQYTNANAITTIGDVNITNNTIFEASESIMLNAGFKVSGGAPFEALIKPCE